MTFFPSLTHRLSTDPADYDQNGLITFNDYVYYSPARANLIQVFPDKQAARQPLAQAEPENNQSTIHFAPNDQDLRENGYTYKVYYVGDRLVNVAGTSGDYDDDVIGQLTANKIADGGYEVYATLAAALKAHPAFDDQVDVPDFTNDDLTNNRNVAVNAVTQNFIVVYEINNQAPQQLVITSDNDPYSMDAATKKYAFPSTVAEAEKTDWFTYLGKAGHSIYDPNNGGWHSLPGYFDSEHTPLAPANDSMPPAMDQRAGYYIDAISYLGGNGEQPVVIYQADATPTENDNTAAWTILNAYLTGDSSSLADGQTVQGWRFNNTEYDSTKMADPDPQIVIIHWAPLPDSEEQPTTGAVHIHYMDVTGITPSTGNQYGYDDGNELIMAT